MKSTKFALVIGAAVLAAGLVPNVGWSTRLLGGMVSGEVTATPSSGTIEVAHHLYHVKAKSPAEKALSSIHAGQNVDIILDEASTAGSLPEVVSITQHAGS
jgi:uncharacterized transporter YbjL